MAVSFALTKPLSALVDPAMMVDFMVVEGTIVRRAVVAAGTVVATVRHHSTNGIEPDADCSL